MKTAVIYARFSCSKQREASIEDQIRVCTDWCRREGIEVLKTYSDYALSGRTDDRPQFQLMISNAPESDYIIVYMFDRFSRNEFDAPMYKRELMMKGVRLVSATENIPDSPEGILYEKLLEGLAACESRKTSIRTRRGMEGNALKCLYNGDRVYGYTVDPVTHRYVIDENQAVMVREAFRRRMKREPINSIAADFARRGVRTYAGKPCSPTMVQNMLRNEKYTGMYIWGDVRIQDGMPAIIDAATFDEVQHVRGKKQRANEDFDSYILSGKAICGCCGMNMFGVSGHGGNGRKYTYYTCKCKGMRPVPKWWLEDSVVSGIRETIARPSEALRIARIVEDAWNDANDRERRLRSAQARLDDASRALDNVVAAVEAGAVIPRMVERMGELQANVDAARREVEVISTVDRFSVDEFCAFLRSADGLDDEALVQAFVWHVVVREDETDVVLNYDTEPGNPAHVALTGFIGKTDELAAETKNATSRVGGVLTNNLWLPMDAPKRTAAGKAYGTALCIVNGLIVIRIPRAA